jgi:hypothetical protein
MILRGLLALTLAGTAPGALAAQAGKGAGTIWFHAGGGFGVAIGTSEITRILNDEFTVALSGQWTVLARLGLSSVFQVEGRLGDAAHDLLNVGLVDGQFQTVGIVEMDFDTREVLLKFNPLPRGGRGGAFYLVGGVGDVAWRDREGDGFSGRSYIIGIEGARLAPGASVTYGVARYAINYEATTLLGVTVPSNIQHTDWVVYFNLAFGVGK